MADVITEFVQDLFSARRMRDFGMELQPVQFPLSIFDRGKVRALSPTGGKKTFRERGHFVAMTVPNLHLLPDSVEQLRAVRDLQHSRAVFATPGENDFAPEMMRHLHQAVTNSENWTATREDISFVCAAS